MKHATPAPVSVDDDVHIQGHILEWFFDKDNGGILTELHLLGNPYNLAAEEGLLQEGFGVGSYYIPNRRLNERMETVEEESSRPMLRYQYECDGPNIKGLHVSRIMEPLPNESSMRVTWTVENKGQENQWVAPWIRNDVRNGAVLRINVPTTSGIIEPKNEGYHAASRNWAALVNTQSQDTVYVVTHADHTHAFLVLQSEGKGVNAVQTAYVPMLVKPGDTWSTMYRLNVVRGLDHVDFASDELAVQLDYKEGMITALIAAVKPMENVHIEARIVAENKRVWKLPRKRFDVSPNKIARCTYEWDPPEQGIYEFLAQLSIGDIPIVLGEDTGSPHGGIDTQFVVGRPVNRGMEAWTDAPHLLDRKPREWRRTMAVDGNIALWFASSLEKVFREDKVFAQGPPNPVYKVALAKNESESFQLCIQPPSDTLLGDVSVVVENLVHVTNGQPFPQKDISLFNVMYHPVAIPSHYEGPTGWWPDALFPHVPFTAEAGKTTPLWITIYARPKLSAGSYRGEIKVHAANGGPWQLGLEIQVFDFELPTTPALKTDFGFSLEAMKRHAARSGVPAEVLAGRYLENAFAHRVTLRELCQFPREKADYANELSQFATQMERMRLAGVSTLYVPASLVDVPQQLAQVNNFVKQHNLSRVAFTQLAYEPEEPAWNRIFERIQAWKNNAPNIPVVVSTMGLRPFIPSSLDIWSLHAQVLDTTYNVDVLKRAAEGGEVWWYVNHMPPRPYGNFFIDFAAIEHRILFWQAWALGMRGMQYWNVNAWPVEGNPLYHFTDITPVNGDGILIYPGPEGPINSIRWETIRDGLEDYDYMALFMEKVRSLNVNPKHEALLQRAGDVYNLSAIVPNLVEFTRDPEVLLKKRTDIASMIMEMERTLKTP